MTKLCSGAPLGLVPTLAICLLAATADRGRAADLLPTSGEIHPQLAPLDRILCEFVAANKVPGAALALAREGKIVYSRGVGWADREAHTPVVPGSQFRIASLSKPITAVAILRLVERERLSLDDKVIDLLPNLIVPPEGTSLDPRCSQITIRQLLHHTGGYDREASIDPMFQSKNIAESLSIDCPPGPRDIIRYMAGRPLDFDPGARHAYSNFGYCLLGRVIEELTGTTYEEHVKADVLAAAGIQDMRLAKSLAADRAEGEVRYYYDGEEATAPAVVGVIGEPVANQYGAWFVEAFDAHGGWLGSAEDLARFAAAVEYGESPLLTDDSRALMVSRPADPFGCPLADISENVFYGLGWLVRQDETRSWSAMWHTGSIPGTAALVVRRRDGLAWAVLFNTRDTPSGQHLGRAIDPLIHKAVDEIRVWPVGG